MDQATFRQLKFLIEPCQTPEELDKYINVFMGIDLPWDIVDEESTSSPLKFIWGVYETMLTGQGAHRHVLAAARNTGKTLGSSILQYFSLLHFRREGNHLAATLDQSSALIRYMDGFMRQPLLMGYQHTDNVRRKEFVGLPANDYTTKSEAALQVITASKKGANSTRCNFMTVDECDLTPPEILSEAAFILDPTRDGHKREPVVVYLSSRKTNDGPIQELIDEAEMPDNGIDEDPIELHKWSAVDWMEHCKDDVSLKGEGEATAHIHNETLQTIWTTEEFEDRIHESNRLQFRKVKAFEGCRTCPAWVACQGRAVKQRGLSEMLRTRKFVGGILKAVKDAAAIIAQALNWKPESTALVFKNFSAYHHIRGPREFYEWVTLGKVFDPFGLGEDEIRRIEGEGTWKEITSITPTKRQIYDAMVEHGWTVGAGIDWGFNPDPAVCDVVGFHKPTGRCAVLHVENALNYANHVWAEYCADNIHSRFPFEYVAPDHADPSSYTYFPKFGIRSLDNKQKPRRIETGVSFIRGLLWDASANESKFMILDDGETDGVNIFMIEEFRKYAHARDVIGRIQFGKFEDSNNHSIDALRYFLHPFTQKRQAKISATQKKIPQNDIVKGVALGDEEAKRIWQEKNELKQQFISHMAAEHGISNALSKPNVDTDLKPKTIEEANKPKGRSSRTSGIKFTI